MIFYDTETCGFYGPTVLIQYAIDGGPIVLWDVWKEPVCKTLELIEWLMEHDLIGFNLTFDHFHLCQTYTTLSLLQDKSKTPSIEEYASKEAEARDGVCLKPKSACDLFLWAKKGPYQCLMDRKPIIVKKVPAVMAESLMYELEERIKLRDIFFWRRKEKRKEKWKIEDNDEDVTFKNIVLRFNPSSALKALAVDALGVTPEETLLFSDIDLGNEHNPEEKGWAPFCTAIGTPENWNGAWPEKIQKHIDHWENNSLAREYAEKDVILTRKLYDYFKKETNKELIDDDDSVLACAIAAIRWKGFEIDRVSIKKIIKELEELVGSTPLAPNAAKEFIGKVMTDDEKIAMPSTSKIVLKSIINWRKEGEQHPAAIRAKRVKEAREAESKIVLFKKLLEANRFHASFKIIGALSGRMSGSDGLNPQGIEKSPRTRSCFPLKFDGEILSGGDFEGFEVTLAAADYDDKDLNHALESGKKIHALFGEHVFTDATYDDIIASKDTDNDMYAPSKQSVFAMIYGGNEHTIAKRLGIDEATSETAYKKFLSQYPGVGKARKKIYKKFCTMRQVGDIGSKIEWNDPEDYIESMLGFRRYFTLENEICKTLFELASKPPKIWTELGKKKVTRRSRKQTASGSVRSALYACAFSIQSGNQRAAGNHRIQSTGAQITKNIQRKIWDLQPVGAHPFVVRMMNIHDEIMVVHEVETGSIIEDIVQKNTETYRPLVPLISMGWSENLASWSEK